ncbi:hypothetical protein COV28_00230 [candidate division WWE3 bacterium CG10_big_fil_rev_8_21_14_0_10_48_23]|nr:MAG: hypothetical protein COV28_00230 [candidate division WWE3 bacterium CG10_big_fil_rev_8_21_14_0_10_48_23]
MSIKEETLQIDGIPLTYTCLGEGEKPLIIIQGWKNWWETFTKEILLNEIKQANLQVFAFDTPQWDTSKGYFNTLEKFCALIAGALDRLDLPKVSICGQSRGAVLAPLFAARYPDRVEKIVLASPPVTLLRRKRGRTLARHLVAFTRGTPPLFWLVNTAQKNYWYNLWGAKLIALYKFDRNLFESHIYPASLQCNLRLSLLNDESTLDVDWENVLSKVSAESAIITGELDPTSRVSDCKALQSLLPNAKLFVIPKTRHGIMMEKPREFAKLIVDFVAS